VKPAPQQAALSDEEILARYGLEPDPVVDAYKVDVDRTLLRQNLKRTPAERWEIFMTMVQQAEALRQAGKRARGDRL